MSNIVRYADFISQQLSKLREDEGGSQSSEASMAEIRAGAEHHGIKLGENPIVYKDSRDIKTVGYPGGAIHVHLLAPKTPDEAYKAGLTHGHHGPPYKKIQFPDGHPNKEAYEKGYREGSFTKGSGGRD